MDNDIRDWLKCEGCSSYADGKCFDYMRLDCLKSHLRDAGWIWYLSCNNRIYYVSMHRYDTPIYYSGDKTSELDAFTNAIRAAGLLNEAHPVKKEPEREFVIMKEANVICIVTGMTKTYLSVDDIPALISKLQEVNGEKHD